MQQRSVDIIICYFGRETNKGILVSMLVKLLLRTFSGMYMPCGGKSNSWVITCPVIWSTLEWKPTPWAHWAACISGKVLVLYKNMYLFSTIPGEY